MSVYGKKLIEVALPLEAINKEAAREKSIRHGHPSTLHLWWRELVRFKRSLPQRGDLSQPRPSAWVRGDQQYASPERA